MELIRQPFRQSRELPSLERHHEHSSARSEPAPSPPRLIGSHDSLYGSLVHSRTSDIDDRSTTIFGSIRDNRIWQLPGPARSRDEPIKPTGRQEEAIFGETGGYEHVSQIEYSEPARSSRSSNGQPTDHDMMAAYNYSDQEYKSTVVDVPYEVQDGFRALCRSRARMSYHWTRYREHYKYVKQERNAVISTIAVMEQELERNPPGTFFFSVPRIKYLASQIRHGHAELAISEAELDGIQDKMLEEERGLRSVERQLSSRLNGDDMSHGSDIFEEMLGAAISLPASPTSKSSSISVDDVVQQSSGQRQMGLPQIIDQLDEHPLSLDVPDAAPSVDIDQTGRGISLPSTFAAPNPEAMTYQASIVEHAGAQFGRPSQEAADTPKTLLEASPLQSRKRIMDINTIISAPRLSDKIEDGELAPERESVPPDLRSNMIIRMLHIVSWSWLEFSTLVHVFEEKWGFIKKYDIYKIDTLLRQVMCSGDESNSREAPSARTGSRVSISTRNLSHIPVRTWSKQHPARDQPLQHKVRAQSWKGYLNHNNRQAQDQVADGDLVSLPLSVIEVSPAPGDRDPNLHQPQVSLASRLRSISLPLRRVSDISWSQF